MLYNYQIMSRLRKTNQCYLSYRDLRDNCVLAECATSHEMQQGLPLTLEARSSVRHHSFTLGCPIKIKVSLIMLNISKLILLLYKPIFRYIIKQLDFEIRARMEYFL